MVSHLFWRACGCSEGNALTGNPACWLHSPNSAWFPLYIDVLREYMGDPEWNPDRVAKDGCGMPTTSNTVNELAVMFANLASKEMRIGLGSNEQEPRFGRWIQQTRFHMPKSG